MNKLTPFAAAALVALLHPPLPALQGSQLVVDAAGGPGADFTAIQPAVSAAAAGDLILVKAGTYAPFAVDGKALYLAAGAAGAVQVNGACAVRNVTTGQVVLQGLRIAAFAPPDQPALEVENCAAPVVLQECELLGGRDALELQSAASLVAVRTNVLAASQSLPAPLDPPPGAGVDGRSSDLHLFDCLVRGGDAAPSAVALGVPAADGAPAIDLRDGFTSASGTLMLGGRGGDATAGPGGPGPCQPAGDGGDGLRATDTAAPGGAAVQLLDSAPAGGSGGQGAGSCPQGAPGAGVLAPPGGLVLLDAAARSLSAPSPAPDESILPLAFAGLPGDQVLLLLSPLVSAGQVAGLLGTAAVSPAGLLVVPAGSVPAGGELTLPVAVGPVQGDFAALVAQPVFVELTPQGPRAVAGMPAVLLILAEGP